MKIILKESQSQKTEENTIIKIVLWKMYNMLFLCMYIPKIYTKMNINISRVTVNNIKKI